MRQTESREAFVLSARSDDRRPTVTNEVRDRNYRPEDRMLLRVSGRSLFHVKARLVDSRAEVRLVCLQFRSSSVVKRGSELVQPVGIESVCLDVVEDSTLLIQ